MNAAQRTKLAAEGIQTISAPASRRKAAAERAAPHVLAGARRAGR